MGQARQECIYQILVCDLAVFTAAVNIALRNARNLLSALLPALLGVVHDIRRVFPGLARS